MSARAPYFQASPYHAPYKASILVLNYHFATNESLLYSEKYNNQKEIT